MPIDVATFVKDHIKPYDGDASFLAGPTERTKAMMVKTAAVLSEELKKGLLDLDTVRASTIVSHGAGYIDKDLETIVGFQGEAPLQRTMKCAGGVRVTATACKSYGYTMNEETEKVFTEFAKTHNDGVFDMYTAEMRSARKSGIITGLPDGYMRGRIIGDYRRVALYGIDRLIKEKLQDKENLPKTMLEDNMRLHEEVAEQIKSLKQMKKMAEIYGHDISKPAENSQEAIQWTYYGYLAAIKQADGAAMSFGRPDGFFDYYIERDLENGTFTEEQVQEFIDHFVVKLRLVRHLRTPEYNDLFAGDPTWVTCVLAGVDQEGKHMVTRTSYRILQTLYNLGPAPEPNLTILWSDKLPKNFRNFCSKVSIDTSSIQYENDDMMRGLYGSDYAIACCVSAMAIGKQMQFFGARCNLAKLLLYTINNGVDEISEQQVGPQFGTPVEGDGPLEFDKVWQYFLKYMEWLTELYVNTMNIIHYSHDKYAYEAAMMSLHDTYVERLMAFGIAGLSVVADALSAIKYAKVYPIRNEKGLVVDYKIEGEFPCYGNDDDRADFFAVILCHEFIERIRKNPTYRNSTHTLSILTITSNVVYGKKTGNTPDGRRLGEAFAPGANPMHGRDKTGAIASLNSVAKINYDDCRDGISNTFSILPNALGKSEEEQISNLTAMLDGYIKQNGFHINVNALRREVLIDAMDHPEKYPQLTIRVSGYAVNFNRLTRAQQEEVLSRTFHGSM
ncbi:hypothetical protein GEMRC1_002203 [Eukaryota sp. GEM-RC1]